ncbi:MAG: AmmeMemoRadiSam system protein B, partial [Firmicutes bacterium]|nr:AmmeMemoRadiSam system protein B [Bacillota bacterium]
MNKRLASPSVPCRARRNARDRKRGVHASDPGRARRGTVVRQPAVAGRFYPRDPHELHRQVSSLLEGSAGQAKRAAMACVVPHAGYM